MIHYLKGTITELSESFLVIQVGEIGYKVYCPSKILSSLSIGETDVKLYTSIKVIDEDINVYGFLSSEEKDIFEMLLTVSGIGPKAAIKLLSLPTNSLVQAIVEEDTSLITSIPKIGEKIAKKIILELKDKLPTIKRIQTKGYDTTAKLTIKGEIETAFLGLKSLGYSSFEARNLLRNILPEELEGKSAEQIIKIALKEIKEK